MIQEPAEIPWFFLAFFIIGTIIVIILSARIVSIVGFTSTDVRALLAKVLQGYRKQSLTEVLDALGNLSRRCPESGLALFIKDGKNSSIASFPRITKAADIQFTSVLLRARQANILIGNTVVMLCLVLPWQFTRMSQVMLAGISMERKTETWVFAERASEILAVCGPAIGVIALMYALYSFFQFRLDARRAYWEKFTQQLESLVEGRTSGPEVG